MCGIFAAISLRGQLPDDVHRRVVAALHCIRHRGPDALGIHLDPHRRFALGHVRLSVIDLAAASNQPFWSSDGRYFLVFNGEIYNYLELRRELEGEGALFRTNSDTEVLLQVLVRHGTSWVNRLNGMWSFVFGDTRTGEFEVCRDRWGVKPLFVARDRSSYIVCSEAKGILAYLGHVPAPNQNTVGLFMKYGVGGEHPESWFEGIDRFPPACSQRLELAAETVRVHSPQRFWAYPLNREICDLDDALGRLDSLFEDAVRIRLRSDVPLGLSLSGGLDSASIAWMVGERLGHRLETFTAWYQPEEHSELPRARQVAELFGHQSVGVPEASHDDTVADLRNCIYHLDSPHNSPAIVPYLNLCRSARRSLTVMLEGQGADELLAGYTTLALFAGADYWANGQFLRFMRCMRWYVHADGWRALASNYVRFLSNDVYRRQALRWGAPSILSSDSMAATETQLLHISGSRHDLCDALLHSHSRGLTNLLQYGDAVSMSVNLETRCPFMDFRLVELGFSLQTSLLVNNGYGKYILRRLVDQKVPDEVCWRRKKDGFTNPTMRVVREVVARSGLPKAGLQCALDFGLFRSRIRERNELMRLPKNILFRLYSVLLWVEEFYCCHDAQTDGQTRASLSRSVST